MVVPNQSTGNAPQPRRPAMPASRQMPTSRKVVQAKHGPMKGVQTRTMLARHNAMLKRSK